MRLRRIVFWCHLAAGFAAGLLIFALALTGVLLAFEPQVIAWLEREQHVVATPSSGAPLPERLGPLALLAAAERAGSGGRPTEIVLSSDPAQAAEVALGRASRLFLDPYSGAVLGGGARRARGFFREVTDWHRWLALDDARRETGRSITGAANAVFLGLAVTGAFLWWPRDWSRRSLRLVTWFRRGLHGRARDFNWHNTAGVWAVAPLLVITTTGLIMSYQPVADLLYVLTGSEPPPRRSRPAPSPPAGAAAPRAWLPFPPELDRAWAVAADRFPDRRSIRLRLPDKAGAPLAFSVEEPDELNPFARSTLTIDPRTLAVVKWEFYGSLPPGRRLRSWVRPLHTGEALGFGGQVVAALASSAAMLLVFTGYSLALRRFRVWVGDVGA